ncbi:MAG: FAD-binding oxidoreductase [Syntrophaceae bacterium]
MISPEAKALAAQCRHYAMCKIDFLGTGLCPAGSEHHYVSYYPQGRMDICHALASGTIPVTEGLVHIAETCNLCGICDTQCHFVTEMRPLRVMRELKEHVESYVSAGKKIQKAREDNVLRGLREIVGRRWATNDPAVLAGYSHDPCPVSETKIPRCVVLPITAAEVAGIVRLCNDQGLPYVVRGNGSSVMGFVLSEGVVIDMNRMKSIEIDRDNWSATIGPGVAAFDLQREAFRHGMRANVAEPAALVAANIMCSGIFSTFSNAYGTAADNYIDAEFVDGKGNVFTLNERSAPNLFGFAKTDMPSPGICTEVTVKLHPMTDDEEGLLVPFPDFDSALSFARELSMRRIGIAIAILGGEYISTFMSPSKELAERLKDFFTSTLGIQYALFVVGDRFDIEAIKRMKGPIIDNRLFRMFLLGLPRLAGGEWADFLKGFEGDRPLYELLIKEDLYPLIEAVLSPPARTLAEAVDEDLRDFYTRLYSRSEMTDLVWLNMFRIISSRMGRSKHVVAFIVYIPLDRTETIKKIIEEFRRIADARGIKNDFGFITPLDFGKRGVLEYDYYIDHTSRPDIEAAQQAMAEAGQMIECFCRSTKGVRGIRYTFNQGFCRSENLLYT